MFLKDRHSKLSTFIHDCGCGLKSLSIGKNEGIWWFVYGKWMNPSKSGRTEKTTEQQKCRRGCKLVKEILTRVWFERQWYSLGDFWRSASGRFYTYTVYQNSVMLSRSKLRMGGRLEDFSATQMHNRFCRKKNKAKNSCWFSINYKGMALFNTLGRC